MSIEAIESVASIGQLVSSESNGLSEQQNFSTWINAQLSEVNEQIQVAEAGVRELAVGKNDNLHQIMISLEKAKLSFELMLQVRNKMMDGYQEIMRMQI